MILWSCKSGQVRWVAVFVASQVRPGPGPSSISPPCVTPTPLSRWWWVRGRVDLVTHISGRITLRPSVSLPATSPRSRQLPLAAAPSYFTSSFSFSSLSFSFSSSSFFFFAVSTNGQNDLRAKNKLPGNSSMTEPTGHIVAMLLPMNGRWRFQENPRPTVFLATVHPRDY